MMTILQKSTIPSEVTQLLQQPNKLSWRENKNGFQNNIQAFLNKISFLLKIFIYPSYIIWAVFWRETMVSQLDNSILIVG